MKILEKCNLCGGNDFKKIFTTYDRTYNILDDSTLVKCRSCKLYFLNPQLTILELGKHYPSNYHSYVVKRSRFKTNFANLLSKVYFSSSNNLLFKIVFSPFLPFIRGTKIIPDGKLLDIGCATGHFLTRMKTLGMDVYGVEPIKEVQKYVLDKKLKISWTYLENAKFKSDFFDVITMNHVLEHVYNPDKTFQELHRILKPSGSLIIAVPFADSVAFNLFKKYWCGLDTPRHLFLFSPKTLSNYAEKNGFKARKIRYASDSGQFLSSVQHIINEKLLNKPFIKSQKLSSNRILFLFFMPICYLLNLFKQGDGGEVFLEKV